MSILVNSDSADSPIVTAVQLNSQQNIDDNLKIVNQAVKHAKQQGSSFVVLPENVCSMGQQHQTAEQFDYLSTQLAKIAEDNQLYLLAGTLPCYYRPDGTKVTGGKLRQVSQLFAPDGTQCARYDKIHLFKAQVNDSHGHYDEGLTFEAGTELVVTPIVINNCTYHIGMMVCFDLRFPRMAQLLRQNGSDILTAPAAFTYQTGKQHWSLLLQARSLDSQCLLIGAGQGGQHHYADGSVRQTWGNSAIVSADGQILKKYDKQQVSDKGYQLISTAVDFNLQNTQRDRLPIFNCQKLT